jgi:hypothetical protein
MKTFIFLTALILGHTYSATGQVSDNLVIKPGENLSKVYNYIYKYPQFEYGKVYFLNGDVYAGKINYNILSEAMQFIDLKGDTLVLANETNLNFISIGADTFYYNNKGYVEQVADVSGTKLLLKENILTSEEKIGAFGIPSSTLNIESKKTIIQGQIQRLTANVNLTLVKKRQYYFSDASLNILPTNSKNVLKVFTKEKYKIKSYLEENSIDFNNEDDLKKFFSYVKSVS